MFRARTAVMTGFVLAIALVQAGLRTGTQAGGWLREHIEAGRLADLRWPGFAPDRAEIRQFYESNGFDLAWIRGNRPTAQALALISSLRAAGVRGLDPEDYDGGRWAVRLHEIRSGTPHGTVEPAALSRFDLELTIAAMRFVSDLDSGRANPRLFHTNSGIRGSGKRAIWIRQNLQYAPNKPDAIPAALQSLEPPFPAYRITQAALARYRGLLADGQPATFAATKRPVKPGDAYSEALRLYGFLRRLGDAPQAGPAPEDYSGLLPAAVARFQERHGLPADGILGPATFRALNVPLVKRVNQIELTLERWRWLPRQFDHPPLIVNIPRFELVALDRDNRVALRMKVIVGKAYGHKTPIFAAEMNAVIFHPWWDVPPNIARNELQPKAEKDPTYLVRNHYEVVPMPGGGSRIRQRPGDDNALGFLKFVFPNRFNVYMHGTPATELFSRTRRDFSHGCIRVEFPELLAEWVLDDTPGWLPDRIRSAIGDSKTLQVILRRPIPVLIVYGTAIAGEDGVVRFFDDIYGYDAQLVRTLAGGRRAWM
jgi:murein L,D-transpeptidase YcbB/YkuD